MSERAQDFQSTKAAPRRVEQRKPYSPIEADPARVPEMKLAALEESRRSASVQQFLDRQRQKHEALVARGSAILKPEWPKLPTEDQASKDAADARETLAAAIQHRTAAEADLHRVAEAIGRQQAVVDAAEAEAGRWAGADAEVHRFIADHAGDEIVLPDGLLTKRGRRDAAARTLADAQGALRLLEADHQRAQIALDAAKGRVGEAVAGVKTAYMVIAAVAMMRHQREAFVFRRIILAARDTL
jgi:hypothetical protein